MEQRLRGLPCGYIAIDSNGYMTEVNDTFLKWMNFRQEEVIGQHIESLFKHSQRIVLHSYFFPNIHLHGQVEELFIKLTNSADDDIPFVINAQKCDDGIECILMQMKKRIDYEMELRQTKKLMEEAYLEKERAFARLEQIYYEIEQKQLELMEVNTGLLKASNTDKLTGVPNRRYFQEKLDEHIVQFQQQHTRFSLLIIDIDYFKRVNDTYGHQIGDVVLVKLASILSDEVGENGIVARFGGEEFTVIVSGADEEAGLAIAKQITQTVEASEWKETGSLTISAGVATMTEQDTEQSLLSKADQALYASKKHGRNRATHYRDIAE